MRPQLSEPSLISKLKSSLREVTDLKTALDEHAIVAVTDSQGRITYANDKFCVISKYSRAELLGQDHRIINSGLHPKEFMRDLWRTIGQGRVWKGEIRNRAKDGSFYWVATTIVPFLDADGKPRQYVSIRTDITQQKNAEEEVRRFNEELGRRVRERTAQLEAANQELEAFSYSVSHDLQAPLRHIGSFAELLGDAVEHGSPDDSRQFLDQITTSTRRMSRLIDDLLSFSRTGREEMRPSRVSLGDLVSEVINSLRAEIKGRNVEWVLEPMPVVNADAPMLRQVFSNLLSNAVKYTRPRNPARIEIGCRDEGPEYVVHIQDNGVGFDMRYADRLFGVFQRLHVAGEFEGTGIGLANVRRIVARHSGRTWAESSPGEGATFYFSLPRSAS